MSQGKVILWENISVTKRHSVLKRAKNKCCCCSCCVHEETTTNRILDNVSGLVRPKEMIALMGAR